VSACQNEGSEHLYVVNEVDMGRSSDEVI